MPPVPAKGEKEETEGDAAKVKEGEEDVPTSTSTLSSYLTKVHAMGPHFHVLGLQMANKKYLKMGVGTSFSLDMSFVTHSNLIFRRAKSEMLYSNETKLCG